MRFLILLAVSFFLGSLPFGYWIPLWLHRQDIRTRGSGNPGFTNVWRVFGPRTALPVLFLDIGKGMLATFLVLRTTGSLDFAFLAGGAAVLGHIFSPFLRGKGGKGIATGFGALIPLYHGYLLIPLLAFLVGFLATRYVSVGSLLGTVAFLLVTLLVPPFRESLVFVLGGFAVTVLVFYRHRENILRLLRGRELRI